MKCPIDQTDLVMSDRHGIEIDYCPKCRGVWLDRGELDKIIERAAQLEQQTYGANPTVGVNPAPQTAPPPAPTYYDPRKRHDDDDYYDDDDRRYQNYPPNQYPPRKKRSFLDDVFDIFD